MTRKCGKLRLICIDEIEATGADTFGVLENNVTFHISDDSPYKYETFYNDAGMLEKSTLPRPFGGVNIFFFGDFWQLNPTGQTAVMSNPFAQKYWKTPLPIAS